MNYFNKIREMNSNGFKIYVDIMTWEKLCPNLGCLHGHHLMSVRSFSSRKVDGLKGLDRLDCYFSQLQVSLY